MKLCAVVLVVIVLNCYVVSALLGGRKTSVDKFPFMVIVAKVEPHQENHFVLTHKCSGTIINPRHVLTAAHCVCLHKNNATQNYAVLYGLSKFYLSKSNNLSQEVLKKTVYVDDIFCHESYKNEVETCNCCDVAILKLQSPLERLYKFVTLSSHRFHYTPREGIVVSWKNHSDISEVKFRLQEITLKIYDNATCLRANISRYNLDYYLCAGCNRHVTTDWGDSGSPLLVNDSQGFLRQIAVLSQGFPSYSNSTFPNCFIRISPLFDEWIFEIAGGKNEDYVLNGNLNGEAKLLFTRDVQ